jgi:hypothetical protein
MKIPNVLGLICPENAKMPRAPAALTGWARAAFGDASPDQIVLTAIAARLRAMTHQTGWLRGPVEGFGTLMARISH